MGLDWIGFTWNGKYFLLSYSPVAEVQYKELAVNEITRTTLIDVVRTVKQAQLVI